MRSMATLACVLAAATGAGAVEPTPVERKHVDAALRELASGRASGRRVACARLRRVGPAGAAAAPALGKLVDHADEGTRQDAVETLGALGSAGVPHLRRALRGKHPICRDLALAAIKRMGRRAAPAVPELVALLARTKDREDRMSLLKALAAMGPGAAAATPSMIKLLGHTDRRFIGAAADVLRAAAPGAKAAVPALCAHLEKWGLRSDPRAIQALEAMGPAAAGAVPTLTKALGYRGSDLSVLAAITLGRIGPAAAPTASEVARLLARKSQTTRAFVAAALGRIGPGAKVAVPALEKLESGEDKYLATHAAAALAAIKAQEGGAMAVYVKALEAKHPLVRRDAALYLGEMGPAAAEAVPALIKRVKTDENTKVRVYAITALGRIGSASAAAVPGLVVLLDGDNGFLQRPARDALTAIGRPAVPALRKLRLSTRSRALRLEVSEMLDRMVLKAEGK